MTPLMDQEDQSTQWEDLMAELAKTNQLLQITLDQRRDWKLAMRQGLLTGLGSVLGATLLVSALLWAMQPLKRLEMFKPTLDRIADQLERGATKR